MIEEYCRLFGVPAQTNQDSFRYKRAAFYSGIKGKVGLIFAKAAALRININTDGSPVAMGRTHITHTSHASHLLSSSLSHHLLPPRSPRRTGGLLIPSPSALALCSTLLLFLSFTLSPRYFSLFRCNKTKVEECCAFRSIKGERREARFQFRRRRRGREGQALLDGACSPTLVLTR